MAEWTRSNLSAIFEPLEVPLSAIRTAAEISASILEPVQEALETALILVQAIDPSQFDISFILNLLLDVDVVHLYPSQPYQALKFAPWVETLMYSFGAGQDEIPITICSAPPYSIFIFMVSADTFGLLSELVTALRAFFGYTGTLFDDIPLTLDRPLVQIEPANCMSMGTLFPWLGEAAEFLSANVQISGSHYVRALQEAIVAKLENLIFLVDDINRILALLQALNPPEVWLYQDHGLFSLAEVYTSVLTASGGPTQASYVAGTGVLTGPAGAVVLGPVVGVA